MKKLLKFAVCLALLVMVVVLFTGCEGKVTGGGWFMNNGEEKVTFGFNTQGEYSEGWEYKGQFQCVNHSTGEKFHMSKIIFAKLDGNVANFLGKDKNGKWVDVTVTDWGQPGADPGDGIIIWHEVYGTWMGFLEGGNISIHEK